MSIHLRPATTRDASDASRVLCQSITECCYEDHRGNAVALQAWLANKTPENVGLWIQNPGLFSVVATVHDQMVGFAMSARSGNVLLCYLVPQVRFTGLGKAMLHQIEAQARRDGLQALSLESTQTAKPFYLRHHFVPNGAPIVAFGMHSYPMVKTLAQG